MNSHPYVRAYMAGTFVPTLFLLVATTVFVIARYGFNAPIPIERAMVFPMALVPNLWGAWNMLYLVQRRRLPIGIHGAILPVLLIPAGLALAAALDVPFVTPGVVAMFAPVGFIAYYLAWKYIVGFLNAMLGIAV